MEKNDILSFLDKHNLKIEAEFVPWSASRSFDPKKVKHPEGKSLNWKVKLLYGGRTVIETDYMAGIGHSPAYKDARKIGRGVSIGCEAAINGEVETGYRHKYSEAMDWAQPKRKEPLLPDACSVIHSLLMDSDVIDHSSFESWAGDFGYDTDSRKAEITYRACLDIGLKLRNGLGEDLLRQLREVFQDY
jgi:hypothetical protein